MFSFLNLYNNGVPSSTPFLFAHFAKDFANPLIGSRKLVGMFFRAFFGRLVCVGVRAYEAGGFP